MTAQSHIAQKTNKSVDPRQKSTWWSAVGFNDDAQIMESARKGETPLPSFVKAIYGGLEECPKTKKVHFQGCLNTSSIYLTKIKSWLPTANLAKAHHKDELVQYCLKADTAVGDKSVKVNEEYLSMENALFKMAEVVCDHEYFHTDMPVRYPEDLGFHWASSICVSNNTSWVSIYSQPQIIRAWKLYYKIFINKTYEKRREDDFRDFEVDTTSSVSSEGD